MTEKEYRARIAAGEEYRKRLAEMLTKEGPFEYSDRMIMEEMKEEKNMKMPMDAMVSRPDSVKAIMQVGRSNLNELECLLEGIIQAISIEPTNSGKADDNINDMMGEAKYIAELSERCRGMANIILQRLIG